MIAQMADQLFFPFQAVSYSFIHLMGKAAVLRQLYVQEAPPLTPSKQELKVYPLRKSCQSNQ